jgi:hypothetical protein
MIAYDSDHTANFEDDESYNGALRVELLTFQTNFANALPREISIYCFYCPMDSKAALVAAFDAKLGAFT